MRGRLILFIVLVVAIALAPTAPGQMTVEPPLPNSLAAIGDSITRAADTCCWYGDHPAQSWSTGSARDDGIRSHYERIRASHPSISGRYHDDAVSGAKMADAEGQAELAVSQGAQYVTILMGANDVCTPSRSMMTPPSTFRTQFQNAMETLEAGLPRAHIFVSSIPNVYRLWDLYHTSEVARFVWRIAGICRSMLSPDNTETDRQAVLDRERKFNDELAQVCSRYANCRFDEYALFHYGFARTDVSKLDYFHPSLSGQSALARVTWSKSWWPAS
jgi:lysophospholipase L1-like esterase